MAPELGKAPIGTRPVARWQAASRNGSRQVRDWTRGHRSHESDPRPGRHRATIPSIPAHRLVPTTAGWLRPNQCSTWVKKAENGLAPHPLATGNGRPPRDPLCQAPCIAITRTASAVGSTRPRPGRRGPAHPPVSLPLRNRRTCSNPSAQHAEPDPGRAQQHTKASGVIRRRQPQERRPGRRRHRPPHQRSRAKACPHSIPGVGAELSVHQLGQAITEAALLVGPPLAIAP